MLRFVPVPLLLAACVAAPVGVPAPAGVRLSAEELVLRLTDGTLCRADWTVAPVGRLDRCGPGFGYVVTVEDRPNLMRQLVKAVDLAVAGGRMFPPMAEVVITDPAGIDHVYVLPPEPAD